MGRLGNFLFLVLLFSGSSTFALTEGWEPKETYALVVGVLQWADKNISTFSKQNRKDKELYDTLLARGVSGENMILLLDSQATKKAILRILARLSSRGQKGSTFIFYYAGHGFKDPSGQNYLANYDINPHDLAGSGLHPARIQEGLIQNFKGSQVLLFADNCFSGVLQGVAKALSRREIRALSLTSAEDSNISTGNWTFSQTLIDGLLGNPLADHDQNGLITLEELADEVSSAMQYRENQKNGFVSYGIPKHWNLGRRVGAIQPKDSSSPFPIGSYLLARNGDRWLPARFLEAKSDRYKVEFYHYSDKETKWLLKEDLQNMTFQQFPVGQTLRVLWGGSYYTAKVLKKSGNFHYITYPGWPAYWNEWVMSNRMKF